eukprot:CAMPEP_0182846152 /NCGR_PEP_ID=MMETSP0006_2-20121128/27735_1 /TAXON_ID=97485 /ORGANISM="Prymnesium parvum, Strain Texoma1" /LENGTH=1069 /DNA_ID=CAMNT_0024976325 /DNA_START=1 /DNA_END=3211 /DNA_ORIENTATION=+
MVCWALLLVPRAVLAVSHSGILSAPYPSSLLCTEDHTVCDRCINVSSEPGCTLANLSSCNWINIDGGCADASSVVQRITSWEDLQSVFTLTFSTLSLLLGGVYMSLFALFPEKMWKYPLNLAFWIYVCDFFVSLQFVIISSRRLQYQNRPNLPWLVSSDPEALCTVDVDDGRGQHPGCICSDGYMSFMLQAGLRDDAQRVPVDPQPIHQAELAAVPVSCSVLDIVILLTAPYMTSYISVVTGYGYRYSYIMCWSPERDFNLQVHLTATIPVLLVLSFAPSVHLYSRHLLRVGGQPTQAMLFERREQLAQGSLVVTCFALYWLLTGFVFMLGWAPQFFKETLLQEQVYCTNHAIYEILRFFHSNHRYEPEETVDFGVCFFSSFMQSVFAGLLSLSGAVNALSGMVANRDVIVKAWHAARKMMRNARPKHARRRGRLGQPPEDASTSSSISAFTAAHALGDLGSSKEKRADMSASLRMEVIIHVLRGIELTASWDSPPTGPLVHLRSSAECRGDSLFSGFVPNSIDPLMVNATSSVSVASAAAPTSSTSAANAVEPRQTDGLASLPESSLGPCYSVPLLHHAPARVQRVVSEATRQTRRREASEGLFDELPDRATLRTLAQEQETFDLTDHTSGCAGRVLFRVFAPRLWYWLRSKVYGIRSEDYTASMRGAGDGVTSHIRHKFSEAKGGGFFFFSTDERYMIKTIEHAEKLTLLSILPDFCQHMYNFPRSLISRISGCYEITMYKQTKYFMVMDNLFDPAVCPAPHEVYDLKGSWIDRHAKPAERTRKDSDWMHTRRLRISEENKKALLRQSQFDARFLSWCRIMDYSLLLGIHIVEEDRMFFSQGQGDASGRASHSSSASETADPPAPESCEPVRRSRMRASLDGSPHLSAATHSCMSRKGRYPAEVDGSGSATCFVPSWSLASGASTPSADDPVSNSVPTATMSRSAAVLHSREQLQHGPRTFSAHRLEGPGEYRLGIIDPLQKWNWRKRLERMAKILLCRCSPGKRDGMSCVEPNEYARRFHLMVGTKVLGMNSPRDIEYISHDWDEGCKEWIRYRHRWAGDKLPDPN